MNQLLRPLYSDQRTPSAFLFRYEPFDTREIREAVGDLVCGLSVYELHAARPLPVGPLDGGNPALIFARSLDRCEETMTN